MLLISIHTYYIEGDRRRVIASIVSQVDQSIKAWIISAISFRASEVRFVCDRMLEGLAKMLRRFGIDTVAIRNEKGDRCVFVGIQEGRYVLTRGANYFKVHVT